MLLLIRLYRLTLNVQNYVDTVSPHNKEDSPMGCLGKHSGATNEQLKCWYTNANSLVGKMDEVRQRITGGKYDIVGITETWAHQGITDAELHIDGYLMFRKDSTSVRN